jgi:hypothetical protein
LASLLSNYYQDLRSAKVIDIMTNKNKTIIIKEDWEKEVIYLINSSIKPDTLVIEGAIELDTIKIRLNQFLEIIYRVRGGSGEHLRFTKVFCVNNDKLKESLSLLTSHKSYSSKGVIQEDYSVKVNLSYRDGKFIANLSEKAKSHNRPVKTNYSLHFEKEKQIFFSQRHNDDVVSLCDGPIKGVKGFYSISLLKESYIYYQNSWYHLGAECYIKI